MGGIISRRYHPEEDGNAEPQCDLFEDIPYQDREDDCSRVHLGLIGPLHHAKGYARKAITDATIISTRQNKYNENFTEMHPNKYIFDLMASRGSLRVHRKWCDEQQKESFAQIGLAKSVKALRSKEIVGQDDIFIENENYYSRTEYILESHLEGNR
jgi:hypothetical protein